MGVSIRECSDDGSAWDEYVAGHEKSTCYHQFAWKRVVERSFGHRTIYLTAVDDNHRTVGVLPLVHMRSALFGSFLVSLPFFNYGGLLCDGSSAEQALIAEAQRTRDDCGADHVELRHRYGRIEGMPTRAHKVTMVLDLESDESVQWRQLDAKVRNQVRKAEKSGLKTVAGGPELLDGFYDVFSRNMRDLGTPVYDRVFFRSILETFPESTKVLSVILDGKPIASAILTWFRDTLEVPWASSVTAFRPLCPNNLLYWEAIRFAISRGFGKFDFGRSTPGEGTFRFKKQWGAQPAQLYWQYLFRDGASMPEFNPSNPKYRLAVNVWRRLPVSVTRLLGPPIVRNIP